MAMCVAFMYFIWFYERRRKRALWIATQTWM